MTEFKRAGISAVPNASRVRGQLLRISSDTGGRGSFWEIAVHEASDVPGMPNFAAAHIGKTITVYVHPELKHGFKQGDAVEAQVAYRGDERGGQFALVEDDVQKA
jgi:hypothetical protein